MRGAALTLCLLALPAGAVDRSAWNGHEPAHRDYRATEEDFRVFEKGLADAEKVAKTLFPRGVTGNDAVLYDTHDLFVYSRTKTYPLPKFRDRGPWRVYRVPLGHPVEEHEMAICSAAAGPAPVEVLRTVTERSFACAPWGEFGRIQKERRSIYRFVEGYWASMIHEYGHQYRDQNAGDPTREMTAIDDIIAAARLSPGTDRARAADEGFATWCELQAARILYPAQYQRMLAQAAKDRRRPDDSYGHDAGLDAAVELSRRKP